MQIIYTIIFLPLRVTKEDVILENILFCNPQGLNYDCINHLHSFGPLLNLLSPSILFLHFYLNLNSFF